MSEFSLWKKYGQDSEKLRNYNHRWHTLPMLKNSMRTLLPAVVGAAMLGLVSLPTADAAVGEMLGRLPAGEISCDQAAAHWTSDADYQARVAQAQTIAAIDPRGGQIVAALGRVDAAAERCGLKGTVNTGGTDADADGTGSTPGDAGQPGTEGAGGSTDSNTPGGSGNAGDAPDTGTGGPGSNPGIPPMGGGGTPEAPVTDAEAVLGPIRNNPTTPTKTIEVLGQGQVEVGDADAMMSNFLRQFTIIT